MENNQLSQAQQLLAYAQSATDTKTARIHLFGLQTVIERMDWNDQDVRIVVVAMYKLEGKLDD